MSKIINKLKYYYYSKDYKKIYNQSFINKTKTLRYLIITRQSGKTLLYIRCNYIMNVEAYNFKRARALKKTFKKVFNQKLFF